MQPKTDETPLSRIKEVKVKLPIRYHVRLHSIKVLSGKQISATVAEALEDYFRDQNPMAAVSMPSRNPKADVESE